MERPRLNKEELDRRNRLKEATVVGIISDTHFPFEHPDYLDHCRKVFAANKVNVVVHIGDMFDVYWASYHPVSPDALSGTSEFDRAIEKKNEWASVFPEMKVLKGNHEARISRRINDSRLMKKFWRTIPEVFEFPAGWSFHDELEVDGVLYIHGHGAKGGKDAAINNAIAARRSVVMGHTHLYGGVKYDNSRGNVVFGLNVGCGVDGDAYVFNYAKRSVSDGTLGCGVVVGGVEAHFFPMIDYGDNRE